MRGLMLSVTIVLICSARAAWAQLEPNCVEPSPERRGEIGGLVASQRGIAWLRLDADGEEPDDSLVFSHEAGEPLRLFH